MDRRGVFGMICFVFLSAAVCKGSDTLNISIRQADSMFIKNNYGLLASSMNIDAQKALVLQAKLYPNPVLTIDVNAFDPMNNKAFHVDQTGQKAMQLEQLIVLGGKRKAGIELAKTNAGIAELEFQDMIRQLKFQLHSSLYFLSQQNFLINKYSRQLELLDTILDAYEVQTEKGNLPLKDIVRLKGVYLNLNNNRAEVFKRYFEELAIVQAILQTTAYVVPDISDTDIASSVKTLTLDELNKIALDNRPDYLVVQQNSVLAKQYLDFQKAMAVPDINLFTSYDQRGGAFNNQWNIGISIPLVLWNRNQGNIQSAIYAQNKAEYEVLAMKTKILSDLNNNFMFYTQTVKEYNKTQLMYNNDFEVTLKGMTYNFQKSNVSLIEFVDFFESYNNAMEEIARIKIQLGTSAEQLNLSAGKTIF